MDQEKVTDDDLGLTHFDLDERWRDFMVGVLAHTTRMCFWLCKAATGRCKKRSPRTLQRRLLNAATSWQWVYGNPDCELSLEEVCGYLGLTPKLVRDRIWDACSPPEDINQVVARILVECQQLQSKSKRQPRDAGLLGPALWMRLGDYRRKYPSGASFEDFCRYGRPDS